VKNPSSPYLKVSYYEGVYAQVESTQLQEQFCELEIVTPEQGQVTMVSPSWNHETQTGKERA